MGYMHISNLYRPEAQTVLLFREVYALEKIHGTSAHVSFAAQRTDALQPGVIDPRLHFHSGGEKHSNFVALFDQANLLASFEAMGHTHITVFGEAYGGSQQGMARRYGKALKFVAFDVKVGEHWLDVPNASQVSERLGLEFVHFVRTLADIESLDVQRDAPSEQARRNGVEGDQPREGIVIRPVQEFFDSGGHRVMAKHKRPEERETKTQREVGDPAKLVVLQEAEAIATEWVTPTRLEHVLDKLGELGIQDTPKVIAAMVEDVLREGEGELVDSKEARKAIGAHAARLFKQRLNDSLHKK